MDIIWAEISCEAPTDMIDKLTEFIVDLSGNGICIENLNVDTFSVDELEDAPIKTIKSYFPADEAFEEKIDAIRSFLAEHASKYTGLTLASPSVTLLKEEDWANSWKKHFKPSRIGRRIVIKPTWEDYEPDNGDILIEIDPGMAFGTGTHPTSRLCLETLERIFFRESPFVASGTHLPFEVLDVGTGSGILAIAALKFGARRAVAIDIDPKAVSVARDNLELNRVNSCATVSTAPLNEVAGQFSVVVANILAEELIRMASELVGKMREGAFLVLSGILVEKERSVLEGFASFPLLLVETVRQGEWSCITFRLER